MKPFDGKRILITGGTGSLGKIMTHRLLSGELGDPEAIIILSRDEAKQHFMRVEYESRRAVTDEFIYHNFQRKLQFRIGDVRDYSSCAAALRGVDVVVNAAAMKQVPTCEYYPYEAVRTNIEGAENIVRAILEHNLPIHTVVGVSTDKACKPVNVMGMSKAVQERVFIQGNMRCPNTRFICTRYGNVLASRGSVVPLFHDQIRNGGPVTITTEDMTRFLLSLNDAVDLVVAAYEGANPGEIWVPRAPSALVTNVAKALIGDRDIEIKVTGIRPGEKIHEIMISDEEANLTEDRGKYYAICPMLPEVLGDRQIKPALTKEYSSGDEVMDLEQTHQLLEARQLLMEQVAGQKGETLR
ncbi:MAG: polysaccharide biosynthesis protein [Fimbriimonas sp.]